MVIDSEEAVSMQLQFNNSPLEGEGIKARKAKKGFFLFFFSFLPLEVVVFCV